MATPAAPRNSIQLIRDRQFGTLFWGKIASLGAVWAFTLVMIMLTYDLTDSVSWVGLVGAAQLVPQLLLALGSGRLADAVGPLIPLIGGCLLSGVSALGMAGWSAAAQDQGAMPPSVPLVVASFLFGCGVAVSSPAMHSIVPRLVPAEELSSAVSLSFLPTALGRAAGPAIGGAMVAAWSPEVTLAVIGVLSLLTCAWFLRMRTTTKRTARSKEDARVSAALRYLWGQPVLLALLVGVGALSIASEPAITLAPALAESARAGEGGGLVVTCFGIGGLLGVPLHRWLSTRLRPSGEGVGALLLLAASILAAGFAGSAITLYVILGVAGVAAVIGMTSFSVAVQQLCAPRMMGRVMAVWVIAFAGSRPAAGIALGFACEHWSLQSALAAAATTAALGAGCVALVARPRAHARDECSRLQLAT